jgi:predicted Rossmann fold nucleotide-binding protein DprA/Smf involved in DNA uptake
VWNALAHGASDLDTLAARAGLPARECMAAVTALELAGCVECAPTGEVRKRP